MVSRHETIEPPPLTFEPIQAQPMPQRRELPPYRPYPYASQPVPPARTSTNQQPQQYRPTQYQQVTLSFDNDESL